MNTQKTRNDFSKGSISGNILRLAVPMTLAQLVNVLYNVVDRVYIGLLPEHASLSLAGLGICLPVITFVMAFANLYGMGGAPLTSIERGRGNLEEAERIMGTSFNLLVRTGLVLTVVLLLIKKPMLYLLGASDAIYPFAASYLSIYMLGNVSVMIGLGMNMFINAQGFAGIGMMTVIIGAVANLILDPVFIFLFHIPDPFCHLDYEVSDRREGDSQDKKRADGAGEAAGASDSRPWRLRVHVPHDQQPGADVLQFHPAEVGRRPLYYGHDSHHVGTGAGLPGGPRRDEQRPAGHRLQLRREGIRESEAGDSVYHRGDGAVCWSYLGGDSHVPGSIHPHLQPGSGASGGCRAGYPAVLLRLHLYGPAELGAVDGSWNGLGTDGVFLAEPISNVIGGSACYITMLLTIWRELTRKEREKKAALAGGENGR